MATEAVIGTPFVFQVLFVDELNTPIAVLTPTINIYYFNAVGTRVDLVVGSAMTPVVPAEVGRYVFPFMIPLTFVDGDALYGLMSGVNPSTFNSTHVEEAVTAISASRGSGGGGSCGMRASFLKTPGCM